MNITKVNSNIFFGSSNINEPNIIKDFDIIINFSKIIPNTISKILNSENKKYFYYNIIDGNLISFLNNIEPIINKINKNLSNNKKILLLCDNGDNICPAILIYYLMTERKMSYDDALNNLISLRSSIEIHEEFENSMRIIDDNYF